METELPRALIVNFFGGPGSGKTTAAARAFVELKLRSIEAENLDEVATQMIRLGQLQALTVQPFLFGQALYRLMVTARSTDVCLMDSPLLLNPIYDGDQSQHLEALVWEYHRRFRNLNFFVQRGTDVRDHRMDGRVHNLQESIRLDARIRAYLDDNLVPYTLLSHRQEDIIMAADMVQAAVRSGHAGAGVERLAG
jgi:RecA/RadA recombinase